MKRSERQISHPCELILKCLTSVLLIVPLAGCQPSRTPPGRVPESVRAGAVDINTATAAELSKLPQIGPRTAARIIEHRERYGRFRRPEHLLLVEGISDRRFRKLRGMIRVE